MLIITTWSWKEGYTSNFNKNYPPASASGFCRQQTNVTNNSPKRDCHRWVNRVVSGPRRNNCQSQPGGPRARIIVRIRALMYLYVGRRSGTSATTTLECTFGELSHARSIRRDVPTSAGSARLWRTPSAFVPRPTSLAAKCFQVQHRYCWLLSEPIQDRELVLLTCFLGWWETIRRRLWLAGNTVRRSRCASITWVIT